MSGKVVSLFCLRLHTLAKILAYKSWKFTIIIWKFIGLSQKITEQKLGLFVFIWMHFILLNPNMAMKLWILEHFWGKKSEKKNGHVVCTWQTPMGRGLLLCMLSSIVVYIKLWNDFRKINKIISRTTRPILGLFIYLFISFFFNLGYPFNALALFFLGAQVAQGHT